MDDVVCILGRGHSASRLITETLQQSGFFMGENINNKTFDKPPYPLMYELAKEAVSKLERENNEWSPIPLLSPPSDSVKKNINNYLQDIKISKSPHKGWKLPETTFIYPWLTQLYPNMKYIYWVRNPLCYKKHFSDKLLVDWGVLNPEDGIWNVEETGDKNKCLSWKLQYDIVTKTPRPKNFLIMRMEDFITNQKEELQKLSDFLGVNLKTLPIKKGVTVNYENIKNRYDFLNQPLEFLNYEK